MIYLDHQATTPCDPRVLAAMLPFFTTHYANPHSAEHAAGRAAEHAVEVARAQIAAAIGADPREIIFTSGATEANNLAIKGAAAFPGATGRRVVTVATEHKCVLESVASLAFDRVVLPVGADGRLDLGTLEEALATPTLLVSVMAVNNETGVIQDMAGIARLAHAAGAKLHTDLAQALGRIPADAGAMDFDLASLSAHKIYGPKGVGALYVRRRPRMRLAPLFSGGGQERGLRSGTLPTPLIVGFGLAAELAAAERPTDETRIAALRDRLHARLADAIPGLRLNGSRAHRIAGNLNLEFPGTDALALLAAAPALCASTGSACTSADLAPSHVLAAMGLSPAEARASLRLGLGRTTSAADVDDAATMLIRAYAAQPVEA